MSHSYLAYIDESGDDGLSDFRTPGQRGGASRWLVISACVIRASRSLDAVGWRDEALRLAGRTSRELHFHKLSHSQKKVVAAAIARKELRFSAVLGKKDTSEASPFTRKNQLYWYLTRYLIERISWLCRDFRGRVREGDGRVQITFARRGGMDYKDFQSYLFNLRDNMDTTIHWPVIDIDSVTATEASRLASLQLADCGARAVAEAFEPDMYGNVEGTYIRALRPRLYHRSGNYMSYGLKLLPSEERAALTDQQHAVLQHFK
ncbi:DUF3800 domain-containing protein [Acuticoccus sp. MNP-M23]|uniref:DUF3800 domain-containing protein n=1 Tax=Acuticoccus sp. MNP-M23 TaxID=3072793 RepID=UPI0035BF1596